MFHGSRSVFMLQVGFHSFSWFQVGLYGFLKVLGWFFMVLMVFHSFRLISFY